MIINKPKERNLQAFKHVDVEPMISYLQGVARAWCNEHKEEWFAARNFLGNNFEWKGSPMEGLYLYYNPERSKGQHAYAFRMAGIAAGHLLLKALDRDSWVFDTRRGYRRMYKLKSK